MYYICHNNSIASSKWLTTHLNLAVVHNLGHLSTVTLKSVEYLLNLGSLYSEFPTPVFSISVRDLVSLWSKNFLCEALLRHCLSRVRHWLVQATLHHWLHHFSRFFSSSFLSPCFGPSWLIMLSEPAIETFCQTDFPEVKQLSNRMISYY